MVQLPSQVMLGLHFVWNKKNNICLCIDIKNNHQYYSDVMICFFYSWCIKHADTCTFNLICWLYLDFQWCLLLILMFPCCRSGGWGGRDGFWDGGVLDQAACPHGAGTEALQGQSLTLVTVDYNPFHWVVKIQSKIVWYTVLIPVHYCWFHLILWFILGTGAYQGLGVCDDQSKGGCWRPPCPGWECCHETQR